MTVGIKDMIARCMERMRAGACASCANRSVCPAGHWQQVFAVPPEGEGQSSNVFAVLRNFIETIGHRPNGPRCFRKDVERALEPMLAIGEVSVDRVARSLGMSRQTLYRRLKAEGIIFEEVLMAKRRQLAIRYLGSDRLSVKVVAYRLGFSDSAAFSRAFKRWTGSSPSELRSAPQS